MKISFPLDFISQHNYDEGNVHEHIYSKKEEEKVLYIGVDLGTSAVKLLLMDSEGRIRKIVSKEYSISFPHPGWAERILPTGGSRPRKASGN